MKNTLSFFTRLAIFAILSGGLLSSPAHAVNNFTITNYTVQMELDRDERERSILRTTETITADFQHRSQNRGIERAFIKEYKGHPTSFTLKSVTDERGVTHPHHWSGDTLRIGDSDKYVSGVKTYVITYTQRDTTAHYEDTAKDEFYWNAIGTDWRVPIQDATVELRVAPALRESIHTELQCYSGPRTSTTRCDVEGENGAYVVSVESLNPREGVTVALGFSPGTFAPYEKSWWEWAVIAWITLTVITSVIAVVVIIWLSVRAHRWKYRSAELGTIVPEYLPPKDASVAAAAAVSPTHHSTLAAELTDLAVRRYIQIRETRAKSLFLKAQYDIEILKDTSGLRDEEREVLEDMFGFTPTVGARLALKTLQNSTAISTRFNDNAKKLRTLMRETYGLKEIDEVKRRRFGLNAKILLVLSLLTLSPLLLIASLVAFVFSKSLWVLSDRGLALRRYVEGLDMYIKVAEAERIKMLQSPEGAEKVGVSDPSDSSQVVKLYEKVLPYAILLGHEKEWAKRLGIYYEQANTQPEWYSGSSTFNAVAFSSMVSNFSTTASSTSSSSSGGSGGGGFSGGGGGGGGGGGW